VRSLQDDRPIFEELSREYSGKIKFAKVNVDENPKTPANYGVRGIPTLIMFKGGKVVDQIVGAVRGASWKTSLKKQLERTEADMGFRILLGLAIGAGAGYGLSLLSSHLGSTEV